MDAISFVPATRFSGSDPSPVDEPELAVLRALARRLSPLCLRPLAVLAAALLLATEAGAAGLVTRIPWPWQAVAEDSFLRGLKVDGDDSGFRLGVVRKDGRVWMRQLEHAPKPGLSPAVPVPRGILEQAQGRTPSHGFLSKATSPTSTTRQSSCGLEVSPCGRFTLGHSPLTAKEPNAVLAAIPTTSRDCVAPADLDGFGAWQKVAVVAVAVPVMSGGMSR